jgi:hypothetical protein
MTHRRHTRCCRRPVAAGVALARDAYMLHHIFSQRRGILPELRTAAVPWDRAKDLGLPDLSVRLNVGERHLTHSPGSGEGLES